MEPGGGHAERKARSRVQDRGGQGCQEAGVGPPWLDIHENVLRNGVRLGSGSGFHEQALRTFISEVHFEEAGPEAGFHFC